METKNIPSLILILAGLGFLVYGFYLQNTLFAFISGILFMQGLLLYLDRSNKK